MKPFAKSRTVLLFFFVAAMTFSTVLSQRVEPPLEDHRSFSWGWPMAWLYIHMIDSSPAQNGRWSQGTLHLEEWAIGWRSLLVSFSMAAVLAVAVTLPFHFYRRRHDNAA
jgi:hypothetical protein